MNIFDGANKNGPSRGHSRVVPVSGSVFVVTMPNHHDPVGVAMTPAFVPAVIAMSAELGACAVAAMMVAVAVSALACWAFARYERWSVYDSGQR